MHQTSIDPDDIEGSPARTGKLSSLLLVEEVNHRVFNDYTVATLQLANVAAHLGIQEARSSLQEAARQLQAHAAVHRALCPPVGDDALDLASYFEQICGAIWEARLREHAIHLVLATESVLVEKARGWRAGLILSELITNAARHGLRGQSGRIVVRMAQMDGEVVSTVCDDGHPTSRLASPGRGCSVVRGLTDDLGGRVRWRFAPHGAQVRFAFPVSPSDVRPRR